MPTVQINDVPDEVHAALRCGAERSDRELARLGCHPDLGLCVDCIDWLSDQSERETRDLRRAVPIFAAKDVRKALELYGRFGFHTEAHDDGYGFILREGVELHIGQVADLDPAATTAACYLHVADADALHAEWKAAGVPGRLVEPTDTDYGLREGAYVDPDGNLIRFGSRLAEA